MPFSVKEFTLRLVAHLEAESQFALFNYIEQRDQNMKHILAVEWQRSAHALNCALTILKYLDKEIINPEYYT